MVVEWEEGGAGGEEADVGVRWEDAGCFCAWGCGWGWDVGVAIFGRSCRKSLWVSVSLR